MSGLYNDKLERFTGAITADAAAEARQIYEAIRQESDHALSVAEDETLSETFRYIKSEAAQIRAAAGQRVSRTAMDNKRALALRRSEMSAEVLALVRERLAVYVCAEAYTEQLRGLAERAVRAFGADTDIYLRAEDMPLAEAIAPKRTPHTVTFREGAFRVGGLRAVCPARRMQIDESFDTTLEELSGRFAELFGPDMAFRTAEAEEQEAEA
ncbi:MAG: V-type ATP synthase subunit E family protein [Oscillospiraceae bacterium]|nr:V-type ATP synthase subunit E family protein [Oscillospiraceae bacterium]